MEEYTITIVNIKTNVESEISIFADEAETTDNIILKVSIDDKEICATDYNYLSAYQKLRDELLEMNYGIKCKGSQLNAIQSGMMVGSDKIYLVQLGRKAQNKDIFSLYEYSDINEFPDTTKQQEFFDKWITSI